MSLSAHQVAQRLTLDAERTVESWDDVPLLDNCVAPSAAAIRKHGILLLDQIRSGR